jgi:actin
VKQGIIEDFAKLELIIKDQIFNTELRISPDEHKMLISEPPNNPKDNREKLVTIMIEEFKVPKLYLGN